MDWYPSRPDPAYGQPGSRRRALEVHCLETRRWSPLDSSPLYVKVRCKPPITPSPSATAEEIHCTAMRFG